MNKKFLNVFVCVFFNFVLNSCDSYEKYKEINNERLEKEKKETFSYVAGRTILCMHSKNTLEAENCFDEIIKGLKKAIDMNRIVQNDNHINLQKKDISKVSNDDKKVLEFIDKQYDELFNFLQNMIDDSKVNSDEFKKNGNDAVIRFSFLNIKLKKVN